MGARLAADGTVRRVNILEALARRRWLMVAMVDAGCLCLVVLLFCCWKLEVGSDHAMVVTCCDSV